MLFEDYPAVRARMNELMDRLDTLERPCCLSHIDSVADNFLFLPDGLPASDRLGVCRHVRSAH